MVEKLSEDYANYLIQTNIKKEISPICVSIDEMLTRLDEFEGLLTIIQNDSAISIHNNIPKIFACKDEFAELCQKIDNLETFVNNVNHNLEIVEQKVVQAEEDLGINDMGLKGFLKPLFSKTKSEQEIARKNSDKYYEPVGVFKASDYFPTSFNGDSKY